jgi:hypothetical protein
MSRRAASVLASCALLLTHCTSDGHGNSNDGGHGSDHDGSPGASGGSPSSAGGGGRSATGGRPGGEASAGGSTPTSDATDGRDATPELGKPGCGLPNAAFCDTFDAPAQIRGRGGELDATLWGASRMHGQLSITRSMGIGMALIPECRLGMSTRVWPDGDTLICDPTPDVSSHHLLVGAASQNYGQNGYRIRRPFDFANRTGTIVFDATVNLLSPLQGWVSLAITEDAISMPGYSILGNDEGSIIPKNAVEIHFANYGDQTRLSVRNVQVFEDYVDTVYVPPQGTTTAPSFQAGKLNHFEAQISEDSIRVTITQPSADGVTFGAPVFDYTVTRRLPFSRGYVHLSVHNHAMLKYTQPGGQVPSIIDATVAQLDNVGFDGPVIGHFREYEVPDALVKFNGPEFWEIHDPYNPDDTGYDIGWFVADASNGPRHVLHLQNVDPSNVTSARLSFSAYMPPPSTGTTAAADYTFRARLNGKAWLERRLSAAEAAFFTAGPTTVDPSGAPVGGPGSQGRFALMIDVPKEDLVTGDNTIEFVSANIPMSYPPLVCNVDLLLETT